jgi:putative intracellular protease/amidase
VAAICGATVFLARLGLLNEREHTSNDLNYLKSLADEYCGTGLYRNEPSVFHRGIVTANGTAAIEFAENIFDLLEISACENVKQWFQYFQNKGVLLTRVQDY